MKSTGGKTLAWVTLCCMAMVRALMTGAEAQGELTDRVQQVEQAKQVQSSSSLAEASWLEIKPGGEVVRRAVERVRGRLVMLETWGATTVNEEAKSGGRRAAMQGLVASSDAVTTGFLMNDAGDILTSLYHLQHNPTVLLVTLHDGSRHLAKVVGRDQARQVALLKIDGDVKVNGADASDVTPGIANTPATGLLLEPGQVKVGQWVIAVGLGYGRQQPAVSVGIVSATGRLGGMAIQTDAALSPINFGGVLVDIEGNVIGLCTAPIIEGTERINTAQWYDAGVGFAIPLAGQAAREWMEGLKQVKE